MMGPWLYLIFYASSCLAHYGGSYDTRNFIVREVPYSEESGEIVECPVCKQSQDLFYDSTEVCPIKKGNKAFKYCKHGTYINEVCDGRQDCYMGPGEECTVKMAFDKLGKQCLPGYYCHKSLGRCIGEKYRIDSNIQLQLNGFPYTWRRSDLKGLSDELQYKFEGLMY